MSDTPPRDLLVVGSCLEAQIALAELAQTSFGGELYHLPTHPLGKGAVEVVSTSLFPKIDQAAPKRTVLLDIWGKPIVRFKLPPMKMVEPASIPLPEVVRSLGDGLEVSRTQASDEGVTVTFSDGSALLCQGVVFGDGSNSRSRAFWTLPVPHAPDPDSVRCWGFQCADLLGIKEWQFRWSTAKSVEILPCPGDRLRVRLRFKSRHGGKLALSELRELFSEFGSDMTALFEDLSDDSIDAFVESHVSRSVFHPAPGCIALGRAAWADQPLLAYDWLADFVSDQVAMIAEQVRTGTLVPESFEAQSQERQAELWETESFLRRQLHHDNVLTRPLRDLVLRILPNSFLAAKMKRKLNLVG